MGVIQRTVTENPYYKANIFSRILTWWTWKLIWNGQKRELDINDCFEVKNDDRAEILERRVEKRLQKQIKSNHGKINLICLLLATFKKELGFLILVQIFQFGCLRIPSPMILSYLLGYFRQESVVTFDEARICAFLIIFINLLTILISKHISIYCKSIGMKLRISICSIVYNKTMRLSQKSLQNSDIGNIINLLSNDLKRCDYVGIQLATITLTPISLILFAGIFWWEYQWAGIIGLAVLLSGLIVEINLSKLVQFLRLNLVTRIDRRLKIIHEVLLGIQIIKIRALESRFAEIIRKAKLSEIKWFKRSYYFTSFFVAYQTTSVALSIFSVLLFLSLKISDIEIRTEKIFLLISYIHTLSETAVYMFSFAIQDGNEFIVSLKRIEKYLVLEEQAEPGNNGLIRKEQSLDDSLILVLNSATANLSSVSNSDEEHSTLKSTYNLSNSILQNISCSFRKGSLTAIIGNTGSGKTSLLNLIMEELPIQFGNIQFNGNAVISYASQEPWIFPGSLRDNILFYEPMNQDRFNAVLKACDLNKDLLQFEHGEHTILSEKGLRLSNGQKTRIGLARAIYREADIYLLDDPFNTVDNQVSKHLFDNCVGPTSFLAKEGATRIVITHQWQYANFADQVLIMADGQITTQGPPSKILNEYGLKKSLKIDEKLELFSEIQPQQKQLKSIIKNRFDKNEEMTIDFEQSSKGAIKGYHFVNYFKYLKSTTKVVIMFILFILVQFSLNFADLWASFWIIQEEKRQAFAKQLQTNSSLSSESSDIWSRDQCIYVHASIAISIFVLMSTLNTYFFGLTLTISKNIHEKLVTSILSVKLQFFAENSTGCIMNRFAKDIGTLDYVLPLTILRFTKFFFMILGSLILASIKCPAALLPIFCLFIGFAICSKIYVKISKNIKRLEGIARSPIYTHISTSLEGLSTIRCLKKKNELIGEFLKLQDLHSATWYTMLMLELTFGILVGLMSVVLIAAVVLYFLYSGQEFLGADIGLTITQIMLVSFILRLFEMEMSTIFAQMISLERISQYLNYPPEERYEQNVNKLQNIPTNWPNAGKIEFHNLNYRHTINSNPVLNEIHLSIRSKEKLGIVGRTGAGKSSLIGSIFRLALVDGTIKIDGLDLALINVRDIRSRILFIPQDPMIFTGTIRSNIDPFSEYSDEAIWNSFENVQMKSFIRSLGGLDATIQNSSNNWTPGQRQLFYMSQAVLRKTKILIFDEITSNLDQRIAEIITKIVYEDLIDSTVLVIAHRLDTIIKCDRVLILENGKIADFASPSNLILNRDGLFRKMIDVLDAEEVQRIVEKVQVK